MTVVKNVLEFPVIVPFVLKTTVIYPPVTLVKDISKILKEMSECATFNANIVQTIPITVLLVMEKTEIYPLALLLLDFTIMEMDLYKNVLMNAKHVLVMLMFVLLVKIEH